MRGTESASAKKTLPPSMTATMSHETIKMAFESGTKERSASQLKNRNMNEATPTPIQALPDVWGPCPSDRLVPRSAACLKARWPIVFSETQASQSRAGARFIEGCYSNLAAHHRTFKHQTRLRPEGKRPLGLRAKLKLAWPRLGFFRKGADPCQGLAQYERVHVVGAFVGVDALDVHHVADGWVFERDPVGAKKLA